MKKIALFALVASTLAVAVAACNTVSGAGRDVQAAGKAVTSTAEEVKH
ncbi:MAG TPA: entericidin A/B family lipoprotein [Phenylobacterium sp.]|nr:entericidin A/B family lipoprotein [Phenylobacterium sp.]